MLCLILIVGGLLIMMGQHDRSEALFYYFRLEDQVPESHLLRLIDKHISFEFVRQQLKDSYSEMGRPSIDPELLLRILLIGYLYGPRILPPTLELKKAFHLAGKIAGALDVYPSEGRLLRLAVLLHDIGHGPLRSCDSPEQSAPEDVHFGAIR